MSWVVLGGLTHAMKCDVRWRLSSYGVNDWLKSIWKSSMTSANLRLETVLTISYIFSSSRSRLLTVDGYRASRLRCACVSDGEFSSRKYRSSGPSLLGGRLIMFGQRRICGGAGIDSKLVISSGLGHDVVCTQRLTIYRGISTSLWETPSERLMSMFHSGREHEVLTINRYVVLLDGP